jgi:hypothetical protein
VTAFALLPSVAPFQEERKWQIAERMPLFNHGNNPTGAAPKGVGDAPLRIVGDPEWTQVPFAERLSQREDPIGRAVPDTVIVL